VRRPYGSSTAVDRIRHGYDRASNRVYRENVLAVDHDELYAYDGLHRLTDRDRGTLNGTYDGVTRLTFAQRWGLDHLGNWPAFDADADGDATWELQQTRSHSDANEISS